MLLTFINFGGEEVAILAFLVLSTVVFAGYKALKQESGVTLLFWMIGIIGLPPIMAIIYLLKTYAVGSSLERQP